MGETNVSQTKADGGELVKERLREFVESLRATPTLARFREAEERFRNDPELGRAQAELRQGYERLQEAERDKRHDPQLFAAVRELQAELQRNPLVVEFVAARDGVQDLLRMANQEMTAILGVDIAANAPRSCCG